MMQEPKRGLKSWPGREGLRSYGGLDEVGSQTNWKLQVGWR